MHVVRSGLFLTIISACAAPDPVDVTGRFVARVEGIAAPTRYADSTVVSLRTTLKSGCEALTEVAVTLRADTVRATLFAERSAARCGPPMEALREFTVRLPISQSFTVAVAQPDGSTLTETVPGAPSRICAGPGEAILGVQAIALDQEYMLRVLRCEVLRRPIGATWTVRDTTIATVRATSDSTALLRAHRVGSTQLTVRTSVSEHLIPVTVMRR